MLNSIRKALAEWLYPGQTKTKTIFQHEKHVQTVLRLDGAVMKQLRNQVSYTRCDSNTTELQIAHQMGVQHVLSALEEGFTI